MKLLKQQWLRFAIEKHLAPGALAACQAQLAPRSREQLRADFEKLRDERQDETPVEGVELPHRFNRIKP